MSYARAKRILMKWERFHVRHPLSGKFTIGPERFHTAHVMAHSRVMGTGRYAPNGIRRVWTLPIPPAGT